MTTETTNSTPRDEAMHTASNLMTDTGTTGRPRRGRYSKAAMLEDIISLGDPRLWPVYFVAVLMALIPVYALFSVVDHFDTVVAAGTAPDNDDQTWRSPEEPVLATTLAGSDAVPAVPATIAAQEKRLPMMAPGDQFALMVSPSPVVAAAPLRSASAAGRPAPATP